MKRLIAMGLLLSCILLPAQIATADEFTTGCHVKVVNCNDYITLRDEPSSYGKELGRIPLDKFAAYIKDAGDGFALVNYDGTAGYVKKEYLKFWEGFYGETVSVSSDERFALNRFLSYFSIPGFTEGKWFFDVGDNPDFDMNSFACDYIYRFEPRKMEWNDNAEWGRYNVRISHNDVDTLEEQYFGQVATNAWDCDLSYEDGYYYTDHTGGNLPMYGFACLDEVQYYKDGYYSVWFHSYDEDTGNDDENCYLTAEQAEARYSTDKGNYYALLHVDNDLSDASGFQMVRYAWAPND